MPPSSSPSSNPASTLKPTLWRTSLNDHSQTPSPYLAPTLPPTTHYELILTPHQYITIHAVGSSSLYSATSPSYQKYSSPTLMPSHQSYASSPTPTAFYPSTSTSPLIITTHPIHLPSMYYLQPGSQLLFLTPHFPSLSALTPASLPQGRSPFTLLTSTQGLAPPHTSFSTYNNSTLSKPFHASLSTTELVCSTKTSLHQPHYQYSSPHQHPSISRCQQGPRTYLQQRTQNLQPTTFSLHS